VLLFSRAWRGFMVTHMSRRGAEFPSLTSWWEWLQREGYGAADNFGSSWASAYLLHVFELGFEWNLKDCCWVVVVLVVFSKGEKLGCKLLFFGVCVCGYSTIISSFLWLTFFACVMFFSSSSFRLFGFVYLFVCLFIHLHIFILSNKINVKSHF